MNNAVLGIAIRDMLDSRSRQTALLLSLVILVSLNSQLFAISTVTGPEGGASLLGFAVFLSATSLGLGSVAARRKWYETAELERRLLQAGDDHIKKVVSDGFTAALNARRTTGLERPGSSGYLTLRLPSQVWLDAELERPSSTLEIIVSQTRPEPHQTDVLKKLIVPGDEREGIIDLRLVLSGTSVVLTPQEALVSVSASHQQGDLITPFNFRPVGDDVEVWASVYAYDDLVLVAKAPDNMSE